MIENQNMQTEEFEPPSEEMLLPIQVNNHHKTRNLIAFWLFGLTNNFAFVIMLSAARDILTPNLVSNSTLNRTGHLIPYCNPIGTGAILLANVLPGVIIKILAPFFMYYLTYKFKIFSIISSISFSLILVSVAGNNILWLSFLGIIFTSMGSSFGEAVFLSLSSFFEKNVVSTWGSGTGAAGLLGSLLYAGLTYVGVKPQISIAIMLVVPLIMGLTFSFILVHPDEIKNKNLICLNISDEEMNIISDNFTDQQKSFTKDFTIKQKFSLLKPLMKYIIPLFIVFFTVYFINQALFEIIIFQNIWLEVVQQYRWYEFTYQLGVFISRSSVNLIHIQHIWIFSLLELIILIVLFALILTQSLPSIWLIFGIILLEGLFSGAAYVNAFYDISIKIEKKYLEFSTGVTTIADSLGVLLAAFISIPVHNIICNL